MNRNSEAATGRKEREQQGCHVRMQSSVVFTLRQCTEAPGCRALVTGTWTVTVKKFPRPPWGAPHALLLALHSVELNPGTVCVWFCEMCEFGLLIFFCILQYLETGVRRAGFRSRRVTPREVTVHVRYRYRISLSTLSFIIFYTVSHTSSFTSHTRGRSQGVAGPRRSPRRNAKRNAALMPPTQSARSAVHADAPLQRPARGLA